MIQLLLLNRLRTIMDVGADSPDDEIRLRDSRCRTTKLTQLANHRKQGYPEKCPPLTSAERQARAAVWPGISLHISPIGETSPDH